MWLPLCLGLHHLMHFLLFATAQPLSPHQIRFLSSAAFPHNGNGREMTRDRSTFPHRRPSHAAGRLNVSLTRCIQHAQQSPHWQSWAGVIYYGWKTQGGDSRRRRDVHEAAVGSRERPELFNTKQGLGEL